MSAMVKYIGTAGARVITADEWKKAGVVDMPTVVWDGNNGFCRPLTDFSMAARPFIEMDAGLVIVDTDPKPVNTEVKDEHLTESVPTGGQQPTRRK